MSPKRNGKSSSRKVKVKKAVITQWRRRAELGPNTYELVMNGKLVIGVLSPADVGDVFTLQAFNVGMEQPPTGEDYEGDEVVLPEDMAVEFPRIRLISKAEDISAMILDHGHENENNTVFALQSCEALQRLGTQTLFSDEGEERRELMPEVIEDVKRWEAEAGMGEDSLIPELEALAAQCDATENKAE